MIAVIINIFVLVWTINTLNIYNIIILFLRLDEEEEVSSEVKNELTDLTKVNILYWSLITPKA